MPQFIKPVPPIVKKKAVFKEYTQSRDHLDLVTGQSSAGNRFIMPLTTSNSKRGGSMHLTEAEVKIEEDSDNPAGKNNEPLPQFRIKKQGMRSQKRQK